MRDAQGRAVRMVGGMTDRTERRRAEDALQRERGFLHALLENLSEGVVACDRDGVLTTFNRTTREFHGLPAEPLPSEQWAARYSLFEADGVTPLSHERIPLIRALRGENVQDLELVIAPRAASPRLVLCNGVPLHSADGELLGAVMAMHDITERRRAEQLESGQRAILTGIAARTAGRRWPRCAACMKPVIRTACARSCCWTKTATHAPRRRAVPAGGIQRRHRR